MANVAMPPLLALPSELIHHILTFTPPVSIAAVSATCHVLRQHALTDQLWQPIVNGNLPHPLSSPAPLPTFHDLYKAHHPYWFLTKHQLWYADSEPNGKLLVARYDPRRGCIEAYAVVAERGPHTFENWSHDTNVAIHSFNPRIQLDLNQPVLKLDLGSPRAKVAAAQRRQPRSMSTSNWFKPDALPSSSSSQDEDGVVEEDDEAAARTPLLSREILMDCSAPSGLYTSFMLARDHPAAITSSGTAVWPPLRIPAYSRTRNTSTNSFSGSAHRPSRLDETSQATFRLRKWIEFANRTPTGSISLRNLGVAEERLYAAMQYGISAESLLRGIGGRSVRMGEDVATFGALTEKCLTPTPQKPWRGVWCGDYSGHGCEFLVVLQPDEGEEGPLPKGMEWLREWFATGKRGHRRGSDDGSEGSFVSAEGADTSDDDDDDDDDDEDSDEDEVFQDAHTETPDERDGGGGEGEEPPVENFGPQPPSSRDGNASTSSEYSGRIEAVKLTGDPNIPRGEYTFIAPDISDSGLVRIAEESVFRGARVVRSAGHVANRGFVGDNYIPSELILASHDRIAQHWIRFGHVSYYQRVDINALLRAGM